MLEGNRKLSILLLKHVKWRKRQNILGIQLTPDVI